MNTADTLNATLAPTSRTKVEARTMHAIVHGRYGEPDVLRLEEIARPQPGDEEVLVRVHAAAASIGDHHVVTGKPYLIRLSPFGGLPRPRNKVPGTGMSGVVEAVGSKVTDFRVGDEVLGEARSGAFAEYIVVPAKLIAPKPTNLSLEDAAALPWAVTALQGLRDAGGLQVGQRVLINGASGGVGGWAVQIAKALGAHVTAVCSTSNIERVKALGADEIIDYTKVDFVQGGARFDLMFDLVGNRSLSDCLKVLLPTGTFVPCSGGGGDWLGPIFRLFGMLALSAFTKKKLKTFIVSPNQKDLLVLKQLVEAGKLKPNIERRYPLSEVADALRHVGEGHAKGQQIIRVSG